MEKITRMPAVSSRKLTIVSGYRCVILMVGLICCIIVSDAFMMGARVLRTCRSRDFSREVINIVQKGRDLTVFATDDNDSEIEEMPINNGEVLKDFLDIADNTESVEDDRINDESNAEESNELPSQRQLVWNAAVKSSVRVKELERTVEEYMRLPASECESAPCPIGYCHGLLMCKSH
jgi:Na+-transporting NADH:ubiquinone oxidoreductase subunit NqrC